VIDITVNDETVGAVTDFGVKIVTLRKDTESEKKAAVEVLKAEIVKREAPYKSFLGAIEKVESLIRSKLSSYHTEKKRIESDRLEKERLAKIDELRKKQAEMVQEDNLEKAVTIETKVHRIATQEIKPQSVVVGATGARSQTRTDWKVEVINPDIVPRPYCEPSMKKLNTAVDSGVREIPGCHIYSVEVPILSKAR